MDRKEKEKFVEKIQGRLADSGLLIVVHQKGLTVSEVTDLRTRMQAEKASYLVAKNTLSRIAVKGTPFSGITDFLEGPTALAFSTSPVSAAKVLFDYAKANEGKITVVGGSYEGRVLSYEELKVLSQLPSMDVLRAKIIAIIQAPMQRMAAMMQAPAGQLARVIGAYARKV
ncbi:MAG: 50S ribosomal protein L10 [Holosporales bacterium]|jgi:large subunit ribosomal protein L10|nr:50S ribosomal protein L10 [Holosporales bacterium]